MFLTIDCEIDLMLFLYQIKCYVTLFKITGSAQYLAHTIKHSPTSN